MANHVFTDFAHLSPPDKPNNWLVAPVDHPASSARPDQPAPVYDRPAGRVAEAWKAMVKAEPRTTVLAVAEDGLRIEAVQKSALFGFTDRISAQFIPLGDDRSTLAAFSRAQIGYWDLGVNRERLRTWLGKLDKALQASS